MTRLWDLLAGSRARFLIILTAEALTSGVEALVHPLMLKALFDQAIVAGDYQRFLVLGSGYLLFGFALNIGGYWISVWRKRFENSFVLDLEMELLDRTLDLDGRELTGPGNASYVSRIHNDVHEGALPAIDLTITLARHVLASLAFLGVLLYLSWQASLILLAVVPPLVLVSNRLAKRIEDNTEPEREAEARYINTLARTLEAFQALRGLPRLMPGTRSANRGALGGFLGITFVNHRLALKQNTLSGLVMNLSDSASMIVGAYFVFIGRMTFGSFLAFVNSLWRAVAGIFEIVNMIPQARRTGAVLARIDRLRRTRRVPYHDDGSVVLLDGVVVHYGEGAKVSIPTFELGASEHVLLRGANGCGKTTLLKVIAGTLAPDTGVVTLPPRVASLTAPVTLPPLPVRDLVTDATLRSALQLEDLVDRIPADLSSGQRQRVGVAAVLSEPADVYLLDEPLANLDPAGRNLVLHTLTERTRTRGLLVVHHGDEDLDTYFHRVVTLAAVGLATGSAG